MNIDTQSVPMGSQAKGLRITSTKGAMAIALLSLIAGTVFYFNLQKTPLEVKTIPPAPPINYGPLVQKYVDLASRQNDGAYKNFANSLKYVLHKNEVDFATVADTASRKAAEYRSLCLIIYFLAIDLVKDNRDTEAYLNAQIAPLIIPLAQELGINVNGTLARLENELRGNSVQLAINIAGIGPNATHAPLSVVTPSEVDPEFRRLLTGLGWDVASVGAPPAINEIVRKTVGPQLLKLVGDTASRILGKQAIRLVASSAIGLASGPLPVGAIVSAVGALWTAYDIYNIQIQFQDELRRSLVIRGDAIRRAMSDDAMRVANVELQEIRKLQSVIGSKALAELSK